MKYEQTTDTIHEQGSNEDFKGVPDYLIPDCEEWGSETDQGRRGHTLYGR